MDHPGIMEAGAKMAEGDFVGAMEAFDAIRTSEPGNHEAHHGWAEAAFMRLTVDMEEEVPAREIMKAYKEAQKLDEDNLEYVASFAGFCLDCGRLPMAVKEYERLQTMAELQGLDVNDMLYEAAARLAEAVDRIGGRSTPMGQKLLRTAVSWSVGGLGFSIDEARSLLSED